MTLIVTLQVLYINTLLMHLLIVSEGKALSSLKEKNQQAAEKWRQMCRDGKQQYLETAKQKTVENADIPTDSWGEATKILNNMHNCMPHCL